MIQLMIVQTWEVVILVVTFYNLVIVPVPAFYNPELATVDACMSLTNHNISAPQRFDILVVCHLCE
jgi:hypothetical protein